MTSQEYKSLRLMPLSICKRIDFGYFKVDAIKLDNIHQAFDTCLDTHFDICPPLDQPSGLWRGFRFRAPFVIAIRPSLFRMELPPLHSSGRKRASMFESPWIPFALRGKLLLNRACQRKTESIQTSEKNCGRASSARMHQAFR